VSISSAGILPAVNPETTGADGVFHWDVSAGYYKVQAVKPGCSTVVIGPYPVPPPQVGLTITLQCANEAKAAAPTVTSLSAGFGPAGGGTVLTLLGTNFTPSSKVTFGTTAAKSVTYLSPQDLTVTASKGSGLVDVRVTTAGGTSAPQAGDRFYFGQAPSVSKISPASGPSAGGTTMTITGANFTGATAVSFGGVAAKKFTVKSATSIVAVTAKGNAGAAPVEVANPAGPSTPGNMATFSYLAPVTAYVTTAAGLVPVSIATGKPGGAIKVTGATGVATTPDGDIVYVTDSKGVTPVSTVSGQPGNPIPVGKTPRAVAVAPDGKTAYAVNYGSGTVTPIDLATGVAGKAIPVGGEPDAIVTTPNGKTAYVANYASGTVTPITVATAKPGKPIKVGTHPDALAVTPNGATLYVANYGSNSVTPVAVATGKPGKPIKVGTDPDGLAITPNGKTLYVANGGSNTVTPVAVATSKAGKAITVGKDPVAAAITPDGTTVYVLNHGAGTITPLVTATGKAGRAITVGKEPVALAITR
jgi:YVTN family beta-propeller protein